MHLIRVGVESFRMCRGLLHHIPDMCHKQHSHHLVVSNYLSASESAMCLMQVSMETFRICRSLLDGVILRDKAAISAGNKEVYPVQLLS